MKVLEQGREQKGWATEAKCKAPGGCGSILLIEQDDVFRVDITDYLGDSETYFKFYCGGCGLENVLKDKFLPFSPPKKENWRRKPEPVDLRGKK